MAADMEGVMKKTIESTPNAATQRGASLFTALIMLLALSIVSLGSLTTSLMELRMANNAEAGMAAFQTAQAGIDAAVADEANSYVVKGTVGDTLCYGITGCNTTMASMPAPANKDKVRITRVTDRGCPPRSSMGSSCDKQSAATFVTQSEYDGTLIGQGRADLVLGYIRLLPAGNQNVVTSPIPTGSSN